MYRLLVSYKDGYHPTDGNEEMFKKANFTCNQQQTYDMITKEAKEIFEKIEKGEDEPDNETNLILFNKISEFLKSFISNENCCSSSASSFKTNSSMIEQVQNRPNN